MKFKEEYILKRKPLIVILCIITAFIFSGLFMAQESHAVPASPDVFEIVQPDGNVFKIRARGDEWNNWTETANRYSIEKDSNGYWRYIQGFDGSEPLLSNTYANDNPPLGLQKHKRPAPDFLRQRAEGEEAPEAPSQAPVGPFTGNILFILAEFTDRAGTYSEANFATFINNNINDYFNKASYGDVTLNPANEIFGTFNNGVVGWVNVGYPHPNTVGSTGILNQQLTKDAIQFADPYVNFAAYDTSPADGYVDSHELAVVVIAAGYETAWGGVAGALQPNVWGHKWDLGAVGAPTVDGVIVGDYHSNAGGYAQFGEIHATSPADSHQATMGIMVHELGHLIFGLPDLYDTTFIYSEGLGAYGVMGAGSWGRASSDTYSGETPVLPCAWSKYDRGWVNAAIGSGSTSITAAGAGSATQANTVFRVTTALPNEYFMVENRQPLGYDRGLERFDWLGAGFGGLAIWHIDSNTIATKRSLNQVNGYQCWPDGPSCATDHFGVAVEQADAIWDLEKGNNRGNATDLWYSGNKTDFNSGSTPDSNLYNGSSSGAGVTSISASGTVMTANLGAGGCTAPFSDITGHWAENYIDAIYCAGITTGFPDGTYRPEDSVIRAQMAAFIIRALYGESFSYGSTPYFPDVPASHWAFKYVQRLFEDGITTGFPDGTYKPDNVVIRAQMAAFIIRALYGESFSYGSTPYFSDVPASHWAFKYVQRLFEDSITTGCGGSNYCPNNVVTRAQMAAFLSRAFLGMP